MNVEIVEFYPIEWNKERNSLTGTLRINLSDIGIHILGVYVTKKKDYWHFNLPGRNGTHHKTGEPVRYPFIVFDDKEMQRRLIDAIRVQGRAFIENKLADTTNPLIWPQHKTNKSNGNGSAVSPAKPKVWVTPPPLKKKAFNSFSRLK